MISPWQLLALRENTAAMDVSACLQIHAVTIKNLTMFGLEALIFVVTIL